MSERLKLIAAVKANAAEAERLRLALETATREHAVQVERMEQERDESDWRQSNTLELTNILLEKAERERDEARAERDRAATIATQEAVGHSRALTALSRARETDGAVGEAAERLNEHINSIWAITPEEFDSAGQPGVAKAIRLAKALLSALSSPPRPETKDDEPDPAKCQCGNVQHPPCWYCENDCPAPSAKEGRT